MTITERHRKAAMLVWEDQLRDEDIAKQCGICRATLTKWKKQQDFQDVLLEIDQTYRTRLRRKLLQAADAAVSRLVAMVKDRKQGQTDLPPETVRKAAMGILELAALRESPEPEVDVSDGTKISLEEAMRRAAGTAG